MSGFLAQFAADLHGRYGDGISSLHVLFPSRRAGLFFGEALSGMISRPMWQPASLTIDGLMEEVSGLATGDRLRLVVELYKIYAEYHPGESFDTFYFWGELLLGDFDSIDKYLIDADVLFSNLVDLHELDNRFDYLSPEQRVVIEKFWGSFSRTGSESHEQRDFLRVWRTLAPVYHRFRARCLELGIAYQGMVYREAAERIRNDRTPQIPERHYVIAGFNALSRCEQTLFEWLQKNFETDFYWDHDVYYTADTPLARAQEAGWFMRDNLKRFPTARPLQGGFDNFRKPKNIRSVAAASDVLQCKYAGLRLADIARRKGSAPGKETAVVLCDESLLTPLLYSMPPEVEAINITMGYPLRMHPAYTFIERLLELQNRRRTSRNSLAFYHSDVEGLLRHPYLTGSGGGDIPKFQHIYISAARLHTTPVFEKIFSAPEGWQAMSDYLIDVLDEAGGNREANGVVNHTAIFAIIADHIRTLAGSLEGCGIDIAPKTYASLLRRSLQSVTVPFEGEPLEGVQVMGILETRALDFENIIFLSAGDSTMPGNLTGAPSFIPYNLKMAYGLPTPEHHEGVYAYHFHRLIQRARNIEMVWSSTSDDRNTGEPSRYILALDYESPHTVGKETVTVDVNLSPLEPITVEKDAAVMEKLGEFLRLNDPRKLSPSLYFSYIECPLKFYFRAVARLRVDDEVTEEIDGAMFGNILHRAMQLLYTPMIGVRNPQKQIRALVGSPQVNDAVTQSLTELYTKEEGSGPDDWDGNVMLIHKLISDYIDRGVLPFDASRPGGYTIESLEKEVSADVEFERSATTSLREQSSKQSSVRFYGKADRIDRLGDGSLRVVDYKTGSPKNKDSATLQMKLYAMMLRGSGEQNVVPELYYIRDMSKPDYAPPIVEQEPEFEDELRSKLSELFDPSVPFTQCPDPKPCDRCDFATICRR